jgi:hypothetical protein
MTKIEYDSPDAWLSDLRRRTKGLPLKFGRPVDDIPPLAPPPVPDADQGHRGQPGAGKPTQGKDDWLLSLIDSQGTRDHGG